MFTSQKNLSQRITSTSSSLFSDLETSPVPQPSVHSWKRSLLRMEPLTLVVGHLLLGLGIIEPNSAESGTSCDRIVRNSHCLTLSSGEVAGIHASTLIPCWVGVPLLRFHPHPSQRRSIGQAMRDRSHDPTVCSRYATTINWKKNIRIFIGIIYNAPSTLPYGDWNMFNIPF
jgi:hypothetical protein